MRSTALVTLLACVLAIAGCGDGGGGDHGTAGAGHGATRQSDVPAAKRIDLVFPYGSEKKHWLKEVTEAFNASHTKIGNGKIIHVQAIPMGSGETMRQILDEHTKAHLWSPASGAFVKLGNAESETRLGKPLVGKTRELVLSPVVIAMWKPMAKALGWGTKPVGWSDILELTRHQDGWAALGQPQWGRFKFGHTHPKYSNSGLISLFAEVYAATGKTSKLTLEDVEKPETGKFLEEIEHAVVHYGSSTGFFGRKLFGNGPRYLSAAVLYENMVIESYDRRKHPDLPFPVVAIYPKEGTFWSDHPVGVVDRPWVTDAHREAAEIYIEYLLEKEQQQAAMRYGFRPANIEIELAAPLDTAHGIDPNEPKTTLEVPSVPVMDAILKLWRKHKKHANIVLVLDTSGSMKGQPMARAREGARALIDLLGPEDRLSFLPFSSRARWVLKDQEMRVGRNRAQTAVGSLYAEGGTALYDAILAAQEHLRQNPTPDRISAIVVLTDGEDRNSRTSLRQLLDRVRADEEAGVKVFTIGYGKGANEKVLEGIADATQAKFYRGTTQNIREVFKEISTFF
jgi:Ca-activated chloride channel family protein